MKPSSSKNHTTSKIVAKSILRLFFVLFVMLLAFYVTQDASKLSGINLYFTNKWVLLFPITLFLLYVTLLILVLKNKYEREEYNWLMSLSGGFLIAYTLLLFARIYPLVFG
ncbi:hypothetical protein [Sphingobacterium corticibacter]|uniref:Uncharacterized protein n=1 Tax=Sphingobacterium corticibacter TaxID=2171749 RepID=A0A2T8HHN3_9SPHI|nr:hypothetical protein [Sphingobacterium corticibacter]PVH24925.1 hypothetical protein DC487_12500 [Sphingobacterium corticibacter]